MHMHAHTHTYTCTNALQNWGSQTSQNDRYMVWSHRAASSPAAGHQQHQRPCQGHAHSLCWHSQKNPLDVRINFRDTCTAHFLFHSNHLGPEPRSSLRPGVSSAYETSQFCLPFLCVDSNVQTSFLWQEVTSGLPKSTSGSDSVLGFGPVFWYNGRMLCTRVKDQDVMVLY